MGSDVSGSVALAFGSVGVYAAMILGLDPGRDKVGWAFVGLDRKLLLSGIFSTAEKAFFWCALKAWNRDADVLKKWVLERPERGIEFCSLDAFVVGKGTGGNDLAEDLENQAFDCRVFRVDESGTTLEARELYWSLHIPSWWQRFLPRTLWVPPRPLDDFAAWAIAMRGMDKIL